MVVRARVRRSVLDDGTWTAGHRDAGADWEEHDEQSVWEEIDDEQFSQPSGGSLTAMRRRAGSCRRPPPRSAPRLHRQPDSACAAMPLVRRLMDLHGVRPLMGLDVEDDLLHRSR